MQEVLKNLGEVPTKMTELVVDTMKKNTELSLAFAQAVEKNNRDFLKASLELVNVMLPGEAKLWDAQSQVVEKTMKMYEEGYEKVVGMFK